MNKKYVDRRSFIRKASMVLGGLGVAPMVQMELIEKMMKKMVPVTEAAAVPKKVRLVEVALRAGINLRNVTPPQSFLPAVSGTINPVVNYHSNFSNITTDAVNGRNVYLSDVAAALRPHAANIAALHGIMLNNGHNEIWGLRTGGLNVDSNNIPMNTPASPVIINGAKGQLGASLPGVKFSGGREVVNSVKNYADLNAVSNGNLAVNASDDFISLFGPKLLRVADTERDAILSAVEQLGLVHSSRLKGRLLATSVDEAKAAQSDAVKLIRSNQQQAIISRYQGLTPTFRSDNPFGRYPMQKGLMLAAAAFEMNLMQSALITIDAGDQHGFNNPNDKAGTGEPAVIARFLAENLAPFIAFLKATPDTVNMGGTLWDNTLIYVTSEFCRRVSLDPNQDNGDGGTQGALLMGGMINGGSYGDVNLQSMSDQGFDPVTGATVPEKVHPSSVYATVLAALGFSDSEIQMEMGAAFGANTRKITAVLKA